MMEWLHKLWTEPDNKTPCPLRVVGLSSVAVYHGLFGWMLAGQHAIITTQVLSTYVDNMSTLVGVVGVAIGAKSIMKGDAKTPDAQPSQEN